MRKLLFAFGLILATSGFADDVQVNGYYRSNGTYVAPHVRTAPDTTINNNYSTHGNYNPSTGAAGTVPQNPYQTGYTGYGSSSGNDSGRQRR